MSLISEHSSHQNDLATVKESNTQGTEDNLDTPVLVTEKETITIIKIPEKEINDGQNVLESAINNTDKELASFKDRSEMLKDDDEIEDHPYLSKALSNSTKGRLSMEDLNTCAGLEAYDTDQSLAQDLDQVLVQDLIQVEPEKEKPRPPFLSDNFGEISSSTIPILENSLPDTFSNIVEENKSEDPKPTLEFMPESESTKRDETCVPCDNNNAIVEPSANIKVQQTTTDQKDIKLNDNSDKSLCDVVNETNIIDNENVSDANKNGEADIGDKTNKGSNHKSNDSLYAQELDESGDLLNITESSSDDLLDDSTFLPSETLLFTPEKFDRFDDEIDKSSGMNLRLSPFSRTAPSTPQPQPGLVSDTTGGLHRLRSQGASSFSNSGPNSVPLLDRISSTGDARNVHASQSSLGDGGYDSSWQPEAANTGADSGAPLSLPVALSAAGSKSYDYLLKVLLVGDSDVGKQEIITGMEDGSLDSPFTTSTGGAAYKTTTILIDGKKVKLHIWDTSGQGRFCTIIRSYSRGAQGILLVYDITNRWSFEGIDRWVREVEEHAPGIPKVLVGNRLHLAFKRQVDPLEAEAYAQKHNMGFYEISPLVNFNITESFQELCRMALKRNGMERLWRGNRVLALHEMCCHAIVANTNVYGIDKLPLPEGVKANLKSYAMTSYPYHRHTFKSWKERKKKLRKEENAAKITNCVNATRKSCTIS